MNHLAHHKTVQNRYYLMRHGQSHYNILGLINSSCESINNIPSGLTALGRNSSSESAISSNLDSRTLFYTSPFDRTVETAEIAAKVIGAASPTKVNNLRERGFGTLNGTKTSNYNQVWKADEIDSSHTEFGVESVDDVLDRLTSLVIELEDQHKDEDIVLVTHGDPADILWLGGFKKEDPRFHHVGNRISTAEIRSLHLANMAPSGSEVSLRLAKQLP
jgi:broad specificity phosphatase PhoE